MWQGRPRPCRVQLMWQGRPRPCSVRLMWQGRPRPCSVRPMWQGRPRPCRVQPMWQGRPRPCSKAGAALPHLRALPHWHPRCRTSCRPGNPFQATESINSSDGRAHCGSRIITITSSERQVNISTKSTMFCGTTWLPPDSLMWLWQMWQGRPRPCKVQLMWQGRPRPCKVQLMWQGRPRPCKKKTDRKAEAALPHWTAMWQGRPRPCSKAETALPHRPALPPRATPPHPRASFREKTGIIGQRSTFIRARLCLAGQWGARFITSALGWRIQFHRASFVNGKRPGRSSAASRRTGKSFPKMSCGN